MRVASDATLERASRVRAHGKSWLELTRTAQSRKAGLDLFRGTHSGAAKPSK